jgi:tetratricopeptide (TPR) repeat protein
LAILTGCSTDKNNARTRWWQAFNTRYNVYYNGSQAYIEGSLEKEQGNVDNFTEMIPLYTVGNKNSRNLGKANFDRAIEKAQKAIKLHSIKRKPVWNKNRRKTPEDIEWLNRREYNPFLWKAWMLMGRAQFHEGDFDGAISTFSYMSRLYATQPAIYGKARAWLVKAYIENDMRYDAEDVIRNMQRDSIHWKARKEWDYAYADYYIHTGDYAKAVEYLRKVIKHEMRRKQKAREYYLLGQLEAALGHNTEAVSAFRHVVRMNPPYQLEFNARIAMTEVMAHQESGKMIKKLKRLAASDNNKDYLDQVYYAMGNAYLAQKDTLNAIRSYEEGNKKGTRNGIEKGVLLLKLGDLYWLREDFSNARRCYNTAIGLLDKERKDYERLSNRSKILDELVPYTEAVHLQDSLQTLAKMSEKDRNAAIDRVIEALKKKEKEERNKKADSIAQQNMRQNAAVGNPNATGGTQNQTGSQQTGVWYFYNPIAVQQGKSLFERQWGKRENQDDWQRSNKTVVAGGDLTDEEALEQEDSLELSQSASDTSMTRPDSAVNDPHKREYYLKQIPFTAEQIEASNQILTDGLYHSGVIFKDKLDNLRLAEKSLRRITDEYPQYKNMADVYYHLYLLYARKGEMAIANSYITKLKTEYPDNQWTILLSDPNYAENARIGTHMEDSLYAATYEAFKAGRYNEVEANAQVSEKRFPMGANRDKFIFIGGLNQLNQGNTSACVNAMSKVVKDYPQSDVAEMAGMILNGVKEGRHLQGGSFDFGDIWQRRTEVMADSDSIQARKFSNERNTNFLFLLVYNPDSVQENKLLFELARYNFSSYLVRDFDIQIEDVGGLHRMKVSGFRNYDEALIYARQLFDGSDIRKYSAGARPVLISEENLPLLGTNFSYDDYLKFYNRHFAPLKVNQYYLLTEPAEVTTQPQNQQAEPSEKEIDDFLNSTTIIPEELEPAQQGTVIPTETEQPAQQSTEIPTETEQPSQQGTVIPTETEQPSQQETVIPAETEQPVQQGTVIPMETEQPTQQGTVIPTETEKPAEQETVIPSSSKEADRKQKTASTKKASGSTTKKEAMPQERPQLDDGVTIYFDDMESVPPSTSKKKTTKKSEKKKEEQKKNQNNFDLEDEYYDLEGF